jgi:RNA polymerase sigma-B factor
VVTEMARSQSSEAQWAAYARKPDPHVREQIIQRYRPLAYSVLNKVHYRGDEDLEQVALLALVKAVDRFDPSSGHHFSSFAVPTILGELRHYLRDQSRMVRCPRPLFELRAAVLDRQRAQPLLNGQEATLADIARDLGVEPEHVVEAMALEEICHPSSLDQNSRCHEDEPPGQKEEILGAADPELERVEERIGWKQALAHLDPRLRKVIELRFYQNLSQQKAAARLGVSQMQVSRLERRALDRLRNQVAIA